ncbi:hypothetical protein ACQCU1_01940 [Sutcliffiella horikoshii]|uniref:hypothetical protein n=1 Tax=Sutcliffiella horikoshii TaxID=79883 RepID=UPI003CEFEE45
MQPPIYIRSIWDKFSTFPMETLTKLWVYHAQVNKPKQRSVSQMKEDRERFGVTGNCYDLAFSFWMHLKKKDIKERCRIVREKKCRYEGERFGQTTSYMPFFM